MPEELAVPFMSIRLTIYHGGTVDELRALNYAENIDQHKRKQHTELDNIWAVREWMASMVAFPELDATKALDVVKYAYALTDLRNREIPKWLRGLLKKGDPAGAHQSLGALEPHRSARFWGPVRAPTDASLPGRCPEGAAAEGVRPGRGGLCRICLLQSGQGLELAGACVLATWRHRCVP